MAYKVWIQRLSFNLSSHIRWRLAVSLTLALLLGAGIQAHRAAARSQSVSAPAQEQERIAAEEKLKEGEALRAQGKVESLRLAVKKYEEALLLWRAIGERRGEAVTLTSIAMVYHSLNDKQKAIDFYIQSLPSWRAVGNRKGEASAISGIGLVYVALGENQKALDFYNRALPLYREVGDRNGEAQTLARIGMVYKSLGEYQKALNYYNQALPLYRALGDRRGEVNTLTTIGSVYGVLGEIQKALDFFNQAAPLYRALGDRRREATSLSRIGLGYFILGENQKALDFYNQAALLYRALGDRSGEANTLSGIGNVYNSLGERRKALDFYNQALPLFHEVGDRRGEAQMLNEIGYVYNSLGERRKALECLNQALPLHRGVGDRRGEARSLSGIGLVYVALGENQKALDFYNRALTIKREVGNRSGLGYLSGEAPLLSSIGGVYFRLGEKQKALDFYNQARLLFRALGYRHGEAASLLDIGAVYFALGENQKALDFYNRALPLFREVGDRSGEAGTLYTIGVVYASLGENQKALDFFNRTLPLYREVGYPSGEAVLLGSIAIVERDLGRFDESRSQIEAALKIIESLRVKIDSKELRASYFATEQSHYEFYVDLLMRMHSEGPARGHDAKAFEASERARARSLLESLTEARADIRRSADPKLIEREKSLQQGLNAKAEEALKLSTSGAGEAALAAHRRVIDALIIELQQVQTQIRRTSPRYAALTQPQPLTLAEIQGQVLDADTLLLEYSLGKERSFLWAVTPTTINSYELPKREKIEAAAKRVHELLSDTSGVRGQKARPKAARLKEASGEYLAAATGLSRTLLGPVAGQLGKKRLVIVADGMLHYIPFGALPDPNNLKESGGNWQPLVVEHEIVNLPSASTIAVLRRELAGRKPAPKALAVLAGPVFSRDDERLKPVTLGAAPQTAQPASHPLNESVTRKLVRIAGGAPNTAPDDLRIERLPFTRQEADRIMALVPAGAGMKSLDFQASRATATSGQLSQYRYVHFATHGLADSERPELSTIVLSLYDEQGRPQDGFLRAHEVYNLELPAELVTLSACETGLGKLTKGEGLVSLTRGFMYAGAARVVVSLWNVNDRATAELMVKFYRRMLVDGERPAAALRAAQVEMWRDKRWESPYYWAAFTLQGEWR